MMSPLEFLQLSIQEQEKHMWANGVYLVSKYQERYAIHLYNLYGFMIEVWYDVERDKIRQITPVLEKDKMDTYLQELSIDNLL